MTGTEPAEAVRPRAETYDDLLRDARALIADEPDWLANLANVAALVFERVPGLNWAGFYLARGDELVLGPFQGRPACVRIAPGHGVCGAALVARRTQVVPDVSAFPGHIACDPRSRSEIVVPIEVDGRVVAVLDLDSDQSGNFHDADRAGLEALVQAVAPAIDWRGALAGSGAAP